MAEKTTYVKIDRNIRKWRWYTDSNTLRVFLHLILSAAPRDWGAKGVTLKRGQLITTYQTIGNALDLSVQQVRTAIGHLRSTGEITSKVYNKFQVITLTNYGYYQGDYSLHGESCITETAGCQSSDDINESTVSQQSANSQPTVNQQQYKKYKNNKNNNNYNNKNYVQECENDPDEFFEWAIRRTQRKKQQKESGSPTA